MQENTKERNLPVLNLVTNSPYDLIIPKLNFDREQSREIEDIKAQRGEHVQKASELYTSIKSILADQVRRKNWLNLDSDDDGGEIFEKAIRKFRKIIGIPNGQITIDGRNRRVLLMEADTSADAGTRKEIIYRTGILALQELIELRINVLSLSEDNFQNFLKTDFIDFERLSKTIVDAITSLYVDQVVRIKDLVNQSLCKDLESLVDLMISENTLSDEEFSKIKDKIDKFFTNIPLLPVGRRKIVEIAPIFEKFVNAKKSLKPKQKEEIEDLLEKHEKLVFQLIGYDKTMTDKISNYEDFMQITFGLSDEVILKRKERGWQAAIEYINTVLIKRKNRELTMDDLRELHKKFAKGIIPFFTLGLRTDDCGESQSTKQKKAEVTVGREDGRESFNGVLSKDLDVELEKLLVKINVVIALPVLLTPFVSSWIGNFIYRYNKIHPHVDKNGNLAVLTAKAIMAMHTGKETDNTFHPHFFKRKSKALGPDILAHLFSFR